MNEVSRTDAPVSPDPEEIIKDITAVGFPAGILDDLDPEPHRLSSEAIAYRVRSARRRQSPERMREAIREILTELELYRVGYDAGFDAGYERAIADILNCVREVQS